MFSRKVTTHDLVFLERHLNSYVHKFKVTSVSYHAHPSKKRQDKQNLANIMLKYDA